MKIWVAAVKLTEVEEEASLAVFECDEEPKDFNLGRIRERYFDSEQQALAEKARAGLYRACFLHGEGAISDKELVEASAMWRVYENTLREAFGATDGDIVAISQAARRTVLSELGK
jgi:hypothetical protein